jgi:hypothetical protein
LLGHRREDAEESVVVGVDGADRRLFHGVRRDVEEAAGRGDAR